MDPIFIVGVPRSGTTLLAAMLAAHPGLSCGPETYFFRHLARQKSSWLCAKHAWPFRATDFLAELKYERGSVADHYGVKRNDIETYLSKQKPSVKAILSAITEQYMARVGKERWVDKTPEQLIWVADIRKHFPKSPIIRIIRDPRDVALSLARQPWGPNTFLESLLVWRRYDDLSAQFFNQDRNSYTIFYHKLVMSPKQELQRLCRFLAERFDDQMLQTWRSIIHVNRINEPWKDKAGTPVDTSRIGVWRRMLTDTEKQQAESLIGDRLAVYAYPISRQPKTFVFAYPMDAFHKFTPVLQRLTDQNIRFWRRKRGEIARLRLYLGDPDLDGWLGKKRWPRVIKTILISLDIIRAKISGRKVCWLASKVETEPVGYCSQVLTLFLRTLADRRGVDLTR